uniref:MKI67 FHA domain-interacting nucleolar phosphoprotein-like n=1 Tax=Myxine glutinosa TaxID=7769 RepID=UPI00358FAFE6
MGSSGLKRRKGQAKNRVHVIKKPDEDARQQEIRKVAKKKSGRGKNTALALNPQQQKAFESQVHGLKKSPEESRHSGPGTIYLGHIPQGFFELEMRRFFSQFGRVTRLRLSRSKRTGRSKGYAFIEFEHEEVAKVVAETMNNYLFYERLLKCEFMQPERVHPSTFAGANRIFAKPLRLDVQQYNKKRNKLQLQRMCSKLLSKPGRLRKKLATHGINYDFSGWAGMKNRGVHKQEKKGETAAETPPGAGPEKQG